MSSDYSKTKNIVIVGGGFAGIGVFNALSPKLALSKPAYKDYNLILINKRPFFVHTPATLRMSVTDEGKLEDQILMPYIQPVAGKGKGEIITGTVVRISEEKSDPESSKHGVVTLEDGKEIPYSVLVVATGNNWQGPPNLSNSREEINSSTGEWRKKFKDAKGVVLVGGGAVGVELAGEIKQFYPEKPVTIVHGKNLLLNPAYPEKWRKTLTDKTKAKGIELILEDFVDNIDAEHDTVTTRSGKKISADLVIPTWGGRPNTELINHAFGTDVITSTGHVDIEKTLQVRGHPRVFVAGDIIAWVEQKQAAKTGGHADVITANVLSLIEGKAASKQYGGTFEAIVVTLGKTGGSGYLNVWWGIILGDWLSKLLKSQGLLTESMRGSFKLGKF